MTDLEELRMKAGAATPGKWRQEPDAVWGDQDADGWTVVALTPCPRSPKGSSRRRDWEKDAAFIAAANPSVVLELIDEIDRCHARLEIDRVYHPDPVAVPYAERGSVPDGVECRDETIRLQDERIKVLDAKIAQIRILLGRAGEACSEVAQCDDGWCSLDEMPVAVEKCRTVAAEIEEALK